MIAVLIQLLAIAFLIPALLAACYHLFLALVALFSKKGISQHEPQQYRFAIIIPAHDEETLIARAVASCRQSAYPLYMFEVFVLADNCSDNTAGEAQAAGATVLMRSDSVRKGKGCALEWAFGQPALEHFNAYVILDADCTLDREALTVFNNHLAKGAEVLQASYGAANADASAISYLLTLGNQIENRLFYYPKSKLGLPILLRGTGMVVTKALLKRVPWHPSSVVEDSEYSVALIRRGIPVVFLWETLVRTVFPVNMEQLLTQRKRWAKGNLVLVKTLGVRLILEGIKKRDFALIDGGWSLLILSRPLILAELMLTLVICAAAAMLLPGFLSTLLLTLAIAAAAIQCGYFLAPLFVKGLIPCRISLLLRVPLVIAALTVISFRGLLGAPVSSWDRTPRSQ
jgi:1,2-diacylglycerol 3-beta-glucosyltransferase